jgi:hypothetical protein
LRHLEATKYPGNESCAVPWKFYNGLEDLDKCKTVSRPFWSITAGGDLLQLDPVD